MPEGLVPYVSNAIIVILVVAAGFIVGSWLRSMVIRSLERVKFDPTLTRFFGQLVRWGVIIMAVVGCLGIFGINTASFAAVIAAAGLAIGLAFQGTLSNFAAGMMLLVFRPFKVGDAVNVSGETGKVFEIELFFTHIDTFDNRRIILPNASVFGAKIENMNFHDVRRVEVPVGVDYPADIPTTRRVLEEAVAGVEGQAEDREPQVILADLGDSAVNWNVRAWGPTADIFPLRERVVQAVKEALDGAEIGIPYPQMDVHLDGGVDGQR